MSDILTPESDEATGHCICGACYEVDVTPRSLSVRLEQEREKARGLGEESLRILKQFYDAEWMVSHEWGGDRESIIEKVEELLKDNGKLDN